MSVFEEIGNSVIDTTTNLINSIGLNSANSANAEKAAIDRINANTAARLADTDSKNKQRAEFTGIVKTFTYVILGIIVVTSVVYLLPVIKRTFKG